ncbi:hypothetical protein NL64_06280 [Pseudomonas fluorescens]|uniref:hypothetical protein n=1 Tax=Pseudomonas fluorescens TaxID=294 RepID=UPI00054B63A4|nr:hypothetical protein [Pseudomonas fluorescens]KII34866.1 hypothetical protein NL64_06280 [Pseudomonas fluorescens]
MTRINITTPHARFYLNYPSDGSIGPITEWLDRYVSSHPMHSVFACVGEGIYFEEGPEGITPGIWTHTPLPLGMDILATQERFENRAMILLSKENGAVDLAKDPSDGRYFSAAMNAAWIMYVDLDVEHFIRR